MTDSGTDFISSDEGPERLPRARGPRPSTAGARATAMSAALSLVLAGGVATAVYRGSQAGTDPATLIPASAFAVAVVDLSAPGDALDEFADHFPGSPTKTGDGSTVDRLVRAMLKDSEDPHVDYDRDIKPWLGDHVAAAAWLDGDDHVRGEFLLQSTDDTSAKKHLGEVLSTVDDPPAVIVRDGYVVLSDTQQHASGALDAAATSSLAASGHYAADTALLPAHEAAVAWLNGPGLEKVIKQAFGGMSPMDMAGPLSMLPITSNPFAGRLAVGMHVTGDTVQVDLRAVGSEPATASAPSSLLTKLPTGTMGAIEVADPGSAVTAATKVLQQFLGIGSSVTCSGSGSYSPAPGLAPLPTRHRLHLITPKIPSNVPHRKALLRQLRRELRHRDSSSSSGAYSSQLGVTINGGDECHSTPPSDPLQGFRDATGLSLPDDVTTLLGDRAVVSFGGLNLTALPDIAVRSHPSSLSDAQAVASTLHDKLKARTGADVGVTTAGDDLVVATSSAYASKVAADGALGSDDAFAAAMGQVPDTVSFAAYVDLSRVWPLVGVGADDGIHHLHALGIWADRSGTVQSAQIRLVVD